MERRARQEVGEPVTATRSVRPAGQAPTGVPASMLRLQAQAGNRAVTGLVAQRTGLPSTQAGARPAVQRWSPFASKAKAPEISGPTGLAPSAAGLTGISAPSNVHVRSGAGPITPVGGIGPLGAALGTPLTQDPKATQAPGLAAGQRPTARPLGGGAPAGPGVIAAGPHHAFPTAAALSGSALFADPSADHLKLAGTEVEEADPAAALALHATESGKLLKDTQRHDTKIEHYSRFFEGDVIFLEMKKKELAAANTKAAQTGGLKKLLQGKKAKEISKIEKQVGGPPEAELAAAKERSDQAAKARELADAEVPLVDGAYEEARRVAAGASAKDAKKTLPRVWTREAGRVGKLVQQAKLSEGVLFLKRRQMKEGKAKIKAKGRGVGFFDHLYEKGKTSLAGIALSTATLGLVSMSQEKTDGGYTSERTFEPIWVRVKRELEQIDEMVAKRPYGAATALHGALAAYSVLLREARNIFGSVALLSTLLSLIPGAAAVFAPVAGFCTLVALGLTSIKLVLDTVLAGWSVITRALNSNARNDDLLTSQSVKQGGDVVGGALAVTGGFTASMAGNALHPGHYNSPIEQASTAGYAAHGAEAAGPSLLSDPGGAAMAGLDTLGSRAPGLGVTLGATAGDKGFGAVTELETVSAGHFAHRAGVGHRRSGPLPKGAPGAGGSGAKAGGAEPAWMAAARQAEASARASTLESLLAMHAAQLRRLHGKTQGLVADNKGGAAKAGGLGKVLEKAGQGGAAAQSGTIAEASERFDTTTTALAQLIDESADPKVLAASGGPGPA